MSVVRQDGVREAILAHPGDANHESLGHDPTESVGGLQFLKPRLLGIKHVLAAELVTCEPCPGCFVLKGKEVRQLALGDSFLAGCEDDDHVGSEEWLRVMGQQLTCRGSLVAAPVPTRSIDVGHLREY